MKYTTAAIQTNKSCNTGHSIAQRSCRKDFAVHSQLSKEIAGMINNWHAGYLVDHEQKYHTDGALM